jgi:CheY-like chemotaxis protein
MSATLKESPRVLVVEPDPTRADALERLLRSAASFRLEIVGGADEALRSMERELPTLLVTSTFLPPADVETITRYVRQMTRGWRLPVVDLPYCMSGSAVIAPAPRARGLRLGLLRSRSAVSPAGWDEAGVREHIEQYLQQAVTEPQPLQDRQEAHALHSPEQSLCLVPVPVGQAARAFHGSSLDRAASTVLGQRPDRRRARRKRLEELPLRWQLALPGASEVRIVNISTSGVLLETATQIVPGTVLDVQLLGQDRNLEVPARMVRTEIVGADTLGVRYRVAAAFARELDVLESDSSLLPADAASLADALQRASAEIERAIEQVPIAAGF